MPIICEAPQGKTTTDFETRLGQVETFSTQMGEAIESIVSSVIALKTEEIGALHTKIQQVEQQLNLERTVHDLERTSRLHPKARRVVFVSTFYFGDNVKYAWLGFLERSRAEGIDCWFLPQNAEQQHIVEELGQQCLPHRWINWTNEHMHVALSAAVVVTSDHLFSPNPYAVAMLAGARHVQLWHGVSIKEIGLRNLPALKHMSPHVARLAATCGPFSQLIGTSAAAESEWRRWFGFTHYAAIGYPRNDVLYREPTAADLMSVDLDTYEHARDALATGGKVWLYAPTWRDANRARWLVEAGIGRVAGELRRRGDTLIVNMHPVEQPHVEELRKALPNVQFVAPQTDIYPLLAQTSGLITDYSSVMFDYLHLDRPIVLFRPDHKDYTEHSRKLFDAKLNEPPGPLVTSANALLTLLNKPLDTKPGADARRKLLEALFDQHDGRSAERLADLLVQEVVQGVSPR